jgi:hypothetical protein
MQMLTLPETLTCSACHGRVGEYLPGGALRVQHKGRTVVVYPPAYVELSCGQWVPRAQRVCGQLMRLSVAAGAAPVPRL